jgi:hypothetical protein
MTRAEPLWTRRVFISLTRKEMGMKRKDANKDPTIVEGSIQFRTKSSAYKRHIGMNAIAKYSRYTL